MSEQRKFRSWTAQVMNRDCVGGLCEPGAAGPLAGSTDIPVLFAESGEPFSDHVIDARDAVRATLLALESESKGCEALNICGPRAFRYTEVAPRVAETLGRRTVDLTLPSFHPQAIDTNKPARVLGFHAEYDIDTMLDEALSAHLTVRK